MDTSEIELLKCENCTKYLSQLPYQLECKKFLCIDCVIRLKPPESNRVQCPYDPEKSHEVEEQYNVIIEQVRQSYQNLYCKNCSDKQVSIELFCKECQEFVCSDCLYDKHKEHFKQAMPFDFEQLIQVIGNIKKDRKHVQNDIDIIEQFLHQFTINPSEFDSEQLIKEINKCKIFINKFYPDKELEALNFLKNRVYFQDSVLIKNMKEDLWLFEILAMTRDSQTNIKLLYRASRDGFGVQIFQQKCYKKKNTVCIFKSSSGLTFGAFVSIPIEVDQGGRFMADKDAFIFQLDKFQKINLIENNQHAIYFQKDHLLVLGDAHDLVISDKSNQNENSYSDIGASYKISNQYDQGEPETQEYLAGSHKFSLEEIEVFQLI